MISATRRWLRRYRTPIAVGVGLVGAGYVVTQYVLNKINDARERMSSERIAKENLRRRFEQNQEDCTFTVLALLPTATTNILETMNTEQITYQIQQMKVTRPIAAAGAGQASPPSIADTTLTDDDGRSMASASHQSESGVHASQIVRPGSSASSSADGQDGPAKRKTKRQLWDDLAISSITRAYTLVYTLGLLTMLTRIQLNLLGRRSYLSSVVSLATGSAQASINLENNDDDNPDQDYGSDFDVNRKYLTFSWWLLNKGWVDIMTQVESAVRAVFGHLSPRDELSLETFRELTWQVRRRVETNASSSEHSSLSLRVPPRQTPRPGVNSELQGIPEQGQMEQVEPEPEPEPEPEKSSPSLSSPQPAKWLSFLLPPSHREESMLRDSGILGESSAAPTIEQGSTVLVPSPATVSPALRRLLDETSDLIESPAFSYVLSLLLNAGFSALVEDQVARTVFGVVAAHGEEGGEADVEEAGQMRRPGRTTVQLPKILSVLTRQAHAIGSGMPNQYLQRMEAVRDLEAFAAVVYSSNWQNEMRDDECMVASAVEVRTADAGTTAGSGAGVDAISESAVFVSARDESELLNVMGPQVTTPSHASFETAWERAVEKR